MTYVEVYWSILTNVDVCHCVSNSHTVGLVRIPPFLVMSTIRPIRVDHTDFFKGYLKLIHTSTEQSWHLWEPAVPWFICATVFTVTVSHTVTPPPHGTFFFCPSVLKYLCWSGPVTDDKHRREGASELSPTFSLSLSLSPSLVCALSLYMHTSKIV